MSEQVSRREYTVAMLSNIERNSSSPILVELANEINRAFLRPMPDFDPLLPSNQQTDMNGILEGFCILEMFFCKKLIVLNQSKAGGPDGIPKLGKDCNV
jgi:hypothetical protein